MKDVVRRAYLLDYYGSLLTEKQRDIYEWYYQQDLSLGEISEVAQVSRNAVHDLVSRTDEKLERYEKALGLIAAGEERKKSREELSARFAAWQDRFGGLLHPEAREELVVLIALLGDGEGGGCYGI
jgi:predicted DNA-binding protein YlxM (UPF0122 family)